MLVVGSFFLPLLPEPKFLAILVIRITSIATMATATDMASIVITLSIVFLLPASSSSNSSSSPSISSRLSSSPSSSMSSSSAASPRLFFLLTSPIGVASISSTLTADDFSAISFTSSGVISFVGASDANGAPIVTKSSSGVTRERLRSAIRSVIF